MASSTRQSLITALNEYQSDYKPELVFKQRMLELLEASDCFLRSSLKAHFTASAWVVHQGYNEAILTHHTKLDRWLQLGGHADGDEDLLRVAKKELTEESGLSNFKVHSNEIFDIDIHTIPKRKDVPEHEHFDVRFLFMADRDEEIKFNHESKDVAWVSLSEIPTLCNGNDSILRMIEKTKELTKGLSVMI
ncbi:NUDIX hydrolase [Roseivirga sp.]|uniref:NUDIX hydrolase n=1 Tax=Roseivirga sp. TaxID=1964215 RepID=UPI003B8AF5B4